MKAFAIYKNNGRNYDEYEDFADCVFLVPDDFDYGKEFEIATKTAIEKKIIRVCKGGAIYTRDLGKLNNFWTEYLVTKYEKLEVVQ